MKKLLIYLIVAAGLVTSFTACQTSNPADSDATPVVKYVRPTLESAADSLLTEVAMGSTVAIIGEGFSGVNEIYFNDQKAKLNPTYVTENSIVVSVPGSMPTEITNTLTLNTATGKSCVFDLAVTIPSPRVSSISCEWAIAGTNATIHGNYFFGTVSVNFPGNLEGTVVSNTETEIVVTVPEGALEGKVTVTSAYGTGRSAFTFRDAEGLFIDCENPSVWNTWGRSAFATEGGVDGQYLVLEGTTGSWAWPGDAIQIYYSSPTGQPLVSEGEVADYVLTFEYYCHTWSDTPLVLWFTPNASTLDVDGADAKCHWMPYNQNGSKAEHVTDGWVTVTIPLSDFNTSKDGLETRSIQSLNDLTNFCAMFFGAADGSYPVKLWMDNFRLVNINN